MKFGFFFFFSAEEGLRGSFKFRGLGDLVKRQVGISDASGAAELWRRMILKTLKSNIFSRSWNFKKKNHGRLFFGKTWKCDADSYFGSKSKNQFSGRGGFLTNQVFSGVRVSF